MTGKLVPEENPAIPCGLVAKSFFNDTFSFYKIEDGVETEVVIKENNIAWTSDVQYKYSNMKNIPGYINR